MHALALALAASAALLAPAPQGTPPATPQIGGSAGFQAGASLRRDLALPLLDGAADPVAIYGPPGPFDETLPVVVLAFWSLRDPLARIAEAKLEAIAADYADRGVKVYLIESNHDELVSGSGDPLEKIRAHRAEKKLTLPLLLDRKNAVADELSALCSNQVYVADSKRVVRYVGAIDDDPRGELRGQPEPWLREAIDLALAGGSPEHAQRRAQGRPLKRAPEPAAPASPADEGGARKR